MINGISAGRGSLYYNRYDTALYGAQSARSLYGGAMALPSAQPELPVQPVKPVPVVQFGPLDKASLLTRLENDPAAMAVRNRIQYADQTAQAEAPEETNAAEAKSAQEVMEESECRTCSERTYQDGSDDPGVSFQTPTRIDPDQAPAAVRGHEQEHVVRNQAKAEREDRKVVSQSVALHTAICPECGRSYISGGTTRTVTKPDLDSPSEIEREESQRPRRQSAPGFSTAA